MRWLFWLTCIGLLLSGCTTAPEPQNTDFTDVEPVYPIHLPADVADCHTITIIFPLEASVAESVLPAGYVPADITVILDVDAQSQLTAMVVSTTSCKGGYAGEFTNFMGAILIEPPELARTKDPTKLDLYGFVSGATEGELHEINERFGIDFTPLNATFSDVQIFDLSPLERIYHTELFDSATNSTWFNNYIARGAPHDFGFTGVRLWQHTPKFTILTELNYVNPDGSRDITFENGALDCDIAPTNQIAVLLRSNRCERPALGLFSPSYSLDQSQITVFLGPQPARN